MNKMLLILSILLMIGVVKGTDIDIIDADVTWKSNNSINQNLTNNASTVPARIVIDYANIMYWSYLTGAPPELIYNASLVGDRIVINYANIMYNSYLYDTPLELDRNASIVTPRITVRYANVLNNPELRLSGLEFVDIKNYKFNKSYIRVPLYTTVTWINFDGMMHNVMEDSGKFSSGNINRNQSFEYKFNLPGVYYYHCKIHPSMKGTIIVITPDKIPPASVTELKNVSYAPNYINWTWKDPKNVDFEKVLIYIDGKYKTSVMKGIQHYKLTNLISDKWYKISTRTVDTGGNINITWVNRTTKTKDVIPPASVTGLKNITYARTYINWTWKDPTTADFSKVMIYLNGNFKTNITKGKQFYNATGLASNTLYNISTHTADYNGNVNRTWVNKTTRTAP